MKEVESKWHDVEITRILAREYYQIACHNPCRHARGRAGWELLKVNQTKSKFQRQYVQLCDQAVSRAELTRFFQSQSVNLHLQ
jgi:hypothetical protein